MTRFSIINEEYLTLHKKKVKVGPILYSLVIYVNVSGIQHVAFAAFKSIGKKKVIKMSD